MARREHDYCATALAYCRDVVSGRQLACELVKMACQRQLDDLHKFEHKKRYLYSWQPELANRICRFIERMPHVKGEWAKHNQSIELEPWQCFLLTTPFGWVRKSDGMRRFRRGYIRIARKNGKSILSAGIGLYMLTADEESGAEVYAAATTWAQSAIAWSMARMMVNKLPGFRKRYGLVAGSRAISSYRLGTTFQPLTGNPGDGSNPHCAIIDEYHEHKTATSYDALATGMGARAQPLLWTITTAGYDRASPCYDLDVYARQVLQGILEDDALFTIIYQLDDGDEWTDSTTWIKANPNLGISVNPVQLAEQCREAQHSTFKQNVFKTKRLNLWTSAGANWLNMRYWDECQDPALRLESFKGHRAFLGLDLASRIDLAALVIMLPLEHDQFAFFCKNYLPEDVVEMNASSTHAHYAAWAKEGWITLTPGNVIDFAYIKEDILHFCDLLGVEAICFDPMQATQLSSELIELNVPMREVKQWAINLSEPMRMLEGWLNAHKIRHNGNPALAWQMSNVIVKPNAKEQIFPRKEVSTSKIDAAVAAIMAVYGYLKIEPEEPSVYEQRGIMAL